MSADVARRSCQARLLITPPNIFTPRSRPEFGWANAMLVVAAEQLLGTDCDAAAEEWRAEEVAKREAADTAATPRNGGRDTPGYYELLEAMIPHAARRLLRWRRA